LKSPEIRNRIEAACDAWNEAFVIAL
jgi:hypothetical protein